MPAARAASVLAVPAGLLALGLWVGHSAETEGLRQAPWLLEAPYVVLGLTAALAFRFHRANLLYVALILAGAYAGLRDMVPEAPRTLAPLAVMVPLNLALFVADSPPALFSGPGLMRLGLLGLQWGVLVGLASPTVWMEYTGGMDAPPAGWALALGQSVLPEGWPELRPPGLAWATGAGVVGWRLLRNPAPLEGAALGLLLAAAAGFHARQDLPQCAVQFCAGGAILISALVQHSYNLAYLDELTELPGRRALKEEMARLRGRYVLAMLDVDHFKSFNDTYGHDVGDQVLRLVASRMRKAAGPGRPFRYGGEEFTMLYPGRSLEEALEALEVVRRTIEETPMFLRGKDRPEQKPVDKPRRSSKKKVTITVSIGASTPDPSRRTPEEVMKSADQALYKAKQTGRNRVCHA